MPPSFPRASTGGGGGADATVSAAPVARPEPASTATAPPDSYLPSLMGAVGLYHVSTAEVGPLNHLRLALHGEYFQDSGFLVEGDTNSRMNGDLSFGYTPLPFLEAFGAILTSSNRNHRTNSWSRRAAIPSSSSRSATSSWGPGPSCPSRAARRWPRARLPVPLVDLDLSISPLDVALDRAALHGRSQQIASPLRGTSRRTSTRQLGRTSSRSTSPRSHYARGRDVRLRHRRHRTASRPHRRALEKPTAPCRSRPSASTTPSRHGGKDPAFMEHHEPATGISSGSRSACARASTAASRWTRAPTSGSARRL